MSDRYMRLIAHISNAMCSDDTDQSVRLATLYDAADDRGKDLLDQAFICLCGWSMKTLIEQSALEEEMEEDEE